MTDLASLNDKGRCDDPPITHRCMRYDSQSQREVYGHCDDPKYIDSKSWPCQRATCQFCVDLNWDLYCGRDAPFKFNAQIRTTFQGIAKSAGRGCQICSLLVEGLTSVTTSLNQHNACVTDMLKTSCMMLCLRNQGPVLVEVYPKGHIRLPGLIVEFYTDRDSGGECLYPSIGYANHVDARLDVKSLVKFAEKMIAGCVERHPVCSTTSHNVHPNRIIDVGVYETNGDVVLTTLGHSNAQYVALSHCWGSTSEMFTTTQATLSDHYHNIPLSRLPKTFRDAVDVTRALNIRYLWIDSLCIIQDNMTDWELESAKMAGIYSGAYLTIAATSSADSQGGFFSNRWTPQKFDLKASIETFQLHRAVGQTIRKVFVRQALGSGHYTIAEPNWLFDYPRSTPPLLKRAWAYQERMLAPRTLHVNIDEMLWECKHSTLCECGYLSWELESDDKRFVQNGWPRNSSIEVAATLKGRLARVTDQDVEISKVYLTWQHIVGSYTKLALTKESDRLPALSGLASVLSHRLRTRYLAGLWEKNLISDLLWMRKSFDISCSRIKASTMPSWSWASIVRMHLGEHRIMEYDHICNASTLSRIIQDPRLKIKNANCQVVGSNPFGEVAGGMISLSGAVIEAKLQFLPDSKYFVNWEAVFPPEAEPWQDSQSNVLYLDIGGRDEAIEVSEGGVLSCILFGETCKEEAVEEGWAGFALVMKLIQRDVYQRVGVLRLGTASLSWWDGVLPTACRII